MAVVAQPHAIVEKLTVVVVVGNTGVAHSTMAHSGKAPDVAAGTVFDRHPKSGVRCKRKRHHIEVLVRRFGGTYEVQVVG